MSFESPQERERNPNFVPSDSTISHSTGTKNSIIFDRNAPFYKQIYSSFTLNPILWSQYEPGFSRCDRAGRELFVIL